MQKTSRFPLRLSCSRASLRNAADVPAQKEVQAPGGRPPNAPRLGSCSGKKSLFLLRASWSGRLFARTSVHATRLDRGSRYESGIPGE
jgi:hypothetical protein